MRQNTRFNENNRVNHFEKNITVRILLGFLLIKIINYYYYFLNFGGLTRTYNIFIQN
jgi:hypothetical protein